MNLITLQDLLMNFIWGRKYGLTFGKIGKVFEKARNINYESKLQETVLFISS